MCMQFKSMKTKELRKIALNTHFSLSLAVFSCPSEIFPTFSSDLELLYANFFSLEEPKT